MLRNNNHRNRDYLRSDRIIRRRRKRTLFRFIFFVVTILIIAGIFVFVSRLDAFSVKNISVEGNEFVSTDEINGAAKDIASTSWMYIVPRKNILFFPTSALETELRARYPRLSNVVVHRTGLDSVDIKVIERKPSAIWCNVSDACYSVDDQGYIYAEAGEDQLDASSTNDLIKLTGGEQGTSTPIGTMINSSSTFSDIATLLQDMKQQGLTPGEVELRNNHEFSVKVLPSGGSVIFSDIRPLGDSLANLEAALQSPAFKGTSTQPTFDYIDTRFGNKIFFKLKQ